MRVACLSEISEAAPHNSVSRFGERFFAKARFEKRRNTVCTRKGHAASVRLLRRQRLRNISSFSNRRIGGKDPPKRAGAIARCCHNKKCFRFSSETLCRASRVIVAARVRNTSLQLPILDCSFIVKGGQKNFNAPVKFSARHFLQTSRPIFEHFARRLRLQNNI